MQCPSCKGLILRGRTCSCNYLAEIAELEAKIKTLEEENERLRMSCQKLENVIRCPQCHKTRSVVWVENPNGGHMHHCNNCDLDWLTEKPTTTETDQ